MRLPFVKIRANRAITASAIAIIICLFTGLGAASASDSPVTVDKTRSRAQRALRQGEYETAEKLFRELLVVDANDMEAHLGLCFSLLKRRDLLNAFEHAT